MDDAVIPLAETHNGTSATVISLQGGVGFQERMASLGVFAGCEVKVLGGGGGGRMLLAVGDTRIAVGHGMAEKILVAPEL